MRFTCNAGQTSNNVHASLLAQCESKPAPHEKRSNFSEAVRRVKQKVGRAETPCATRRQAAVPCQHPKDFESREPGDRLKANPACAVASSRRVSGTLTKRPFHKLLDTLEGQLPIG
jgi:hypothetical protein